MKRLAVVLTLACLMVLTSSVFAAPMLTGAGNVPSDWPATPIFYEGGPLVGPDASTDTSGTFNAIRIEWISGSLFEVPGVQNLSAGWSYIGGNDKIALATGPAVSALNLTVNFASASLEPAVYDFQAYLNGGCVDAWTMYLDSNGSWNDQVYTPANGSGYVSWGSPYYVAIPNEFTEVSSAVPEPVSMIFFGTGLVGVCGYLARRRNR